MISFVSKEIPGARRRVMEQGLIVGQGPGLRHPSFHKKFISCLQNAFWKLSTLTTNVFFLSRALAVCTSVTVE